MRIEKKAIFTIGHSTLSINDFSARLQSFGIKTLVDVRTIPGSKHNPQFNKEELRKAMISRRIKYIHMPGLGGLRKAAKSSINAGWKNASFRGYADYMQTPEFKKSLLKLITLAKRTVAAIMCAEALPWKCHRSLIADALIIRGFIVSDIFPNGNSVNRKITPWAKARGNTITYPAARPSVLKSNK